MAPLFAPSGGPRALYQRGYAPRMEVVDLVRVAVKYGVQKISITVGSLSVLRGKSSRFL